MTLHIKICGNTDLDHARIATDEGADMLGFIFYPPSPRYVTPQDATEIVTTLRAEYGDTAPKMVGVFVDETVERVQSLISDVGLNLVQLHGSEPPVEVRMLQPYAFKAVRPQNRGDAEAVAATYASVLSTDPNVPQFLLDAHHPWKFGGTGTTADWVVGLVLARRFRLLLAGGLNPENVAEAIQTVKPWGVDTVSGVEKSKGVKDPEHLRAFIRAAKAASSLNTD